MKTKNPKSSNSKGARATSPTKPWAAKEGRPTQAIIESNRKTELCRNWEKGCCTYGGRCAFAHGTKELKYRTLREMEDAGRIPDATKYRCYPCMTWVATGSCPYSTRCVFIHDPRVQGACEAWLPAGCQPKSTPPAYPSSDCSFFFPDMSRDPDSLELPTHPARYELDPSMANNKDIANKAVYNLWYSFVGTLVEASLDDSDIIDVNPHALRPSNSRVGARVHPSRGIRDNFGRGFFASGPESTASYWDAAPAFDTAPRFPDAGVSSTYVTADGGMRGGGAPRRGAPSLSREEIRRPRGETSHLPCLLRLSRGNTARPAIPPYLSTSFEDASACGTSRTPKRSWCGFDDLHSPASMESFSDDDSSTGTMPCSTPSSQSSDRGCSCCCTSEAFHHASHGMSAALSRYTVIRHDEQALSGVFEPRETSLEKTLRPLAPYDAHYGARR